MRAQEFQKPIFPTLLSGDNPTAALIHLAGVQYTDFRDQATREQNFKLLVKTLAGYFDHHLPDFDMKSSRSGVSVVHVNVSGYVEGNLYTVQSSTHVAAGQRER